MIGGPFRLTGCTERSWLERNKQLAFVAIVAIAMISLAVSYLHFRRRISTLFILCSTPERSLDGVEIMQHAVRIAARFRRKFQIVYDQAGSSNAYEQRDKDVNWNSSDSVADSSCAPPALQADASPQ